jgi:ribonucleoside-diphosphate reductase alpha chain
MWANREAVRESMWANRDRYSGISLLPFDGGTYAQAPFEDCDEATYNHYANLVQNIDLMQVKEPKEEHNVAETVACAGGVCEVTSL